MKKISELMSLEGRSALVTGGAGHIGLAMAAALSELGAQVAILDRPETLERVDVPDLVRIPGDLQYADQTRSAVQDAISQLGGLDVLVHSAAFVGTTQFPGWAVDFEKQSAEAWDAAMAVNLRSAFLLAQESHEALQRAGRGSIVFLSSIYGMVGPDDRLYQGTSMANPMAYGASKAALIQLARSLATKMAPGVRVNTITPGGVLRDQPASFRQRYCERVPLGRMATEQDLIGAVAYLASDLSAYVTGHNLVVDGGWTSW